ncbi:ParB/RepB/Spo0J family partition protein [Candidatus Wolfebacteria bacterium]|nr:ParB/RepB/Spo0J family partition protein [Candidatus Wolfebacteria bacterium]
MLGKGLSSLIPPKKPQQNERVEKNFVYPQNQQNINNQTDEKQTALSEKNFYPLKTPSSEESKQISEFQKPSVPIVENKPKEKQLINQSVYQSPQSNNKPNNFSYVKSENNNISKTKPLIKDSIFQIEIENIKPNPHQPRRYFDQEALKDLAASIREYGILQPLVVSKIEKENDFGTKVEYELIAGERRLMAAKILNWKKVPVIIKRIGQKSEQLAIAVIENLQRANLSPIETARAYAKLQDQFGLTQREISVKIGKSRESIANNLRLLNLPGEIQEALSQNKINESQARLLLIIEDSSQQQNLFQDILKNNLTVRELKRKIHKTNQNTPSEQKFETTNPDLLVFQEKLTELLGARVKIISQSNSEKSGKGKIVITFFSPEEIQGIIEKFKDADE